jgi:hypothetical protein
LAESWADVDASFGGGSSLNDEARWIGTTVTMQLHRGLPIDDLLARLDVIAAAVSDPSVPAEVLAHQASLALVAGDFPRAARLNLEAADLGAQISFIYLSFAVRAFLLAGDAEGARLALARHWRESPGNLIDDALGLAGEAGIAALDGRLDEAIAGYREAVERLEAIHIEWLVALLGFEFASLVGVDHPATREAVARSREIFERIGARPWLEKLDALEASPSAVPARSRATTAAAADPRPVEAPRA